jgi:hypothetical protein
VPQRFGTVRFSTAPVTGTGVGDASWGQLKDSLP